MTGEEAGRIIATWLVSSKGAKGQRGYVEGWFDEKDAEAFRIAIEALSADAVQVVRCGQCEHWKCNPTTNEYGVCNKVSYDEFEVVMDSDDFCSYGRKENNQ